MDGATGADGGASVRTVLCTVATPNFLHYALNLARSVQRNWPGAPVVRIAVVGGQGWAMPDLTPFADVQLVAAEELGIPNFGWLAAKYSATELCCAVKPFLVTHALTSGAERVVYSDADMHFFAPPHSLLDLSLRHSFTVLPHTLRPYRPEEAWFRPSLGDLFAAGIMNAGLFAVREGEEARRFLDTWSTLVTAPGAFLRALGPQHEQNSFNWVLAFVEDVAVCRDPAVNVAYWNLHERSLRWAALDGGSEEAWTLETGPLACFHFSGFEAGPGRLTHFDNRNDLALDINLHALCDFYTRQLAAAGRAEFESIPYAYGRVKAGALDRGARDFLKAAERLLVPPPVIRDWPGDLEPVFDRLANAIGPSHCVPLILDEIVRERPDLRHLPSADRLVPQALLQWATEWLHREYDSAFLFDRHCAFAYARHELRATAAQVVSALPELGVEEAGDLLRHDRVQIIGRLEERGGAPRLVEAIRRASYRYPAFDPGLCLRLIYLSRSDLQAVFPDPLEADLEAFRAWAVHQLPVEYEIPAAMVEWVPELDPARSLARILSFVRLDAARTSRFFEVGLERELLCNLLPLVMQEPGFSASDVTVADWWAWSPEWTVAPEDRIPAPAGFLARLLQRRASSADAADAAHAADALGNEHSRAVTFTPRRSPKTTTVETWSREVPHTVASDPQSADPEGLNVFGYFRSPIGLGTATRGLCSSLGFAGYRLRQVVLSNMTMDSAFGLADLMPDSRLWYGRNLIVTYPHHSGSPLDVFPQALFRDRSSIGYFAWEQRDAHPGWRRDLDRYDRLLALSAFSAQSLGRAAGREVGVLPCVVEVDEAAARPFGRAHHGIPAAAFVAGIVFDASSSVERKNPLAAARALVRAFGGQRDVRVVLKVTNGGRVPYDRAVAEVRRLLTDGGVEVLVFVESMPVAEMHGLISTFDLCISLHRAEGFGYSLAEAMVLGVPAVATRYSGNLDFMNDGNSWLVDCQECRVQRPEGPFRRGTVWADPDVEQAAGLCRSIYEDRDGAANRALVAKREVSQTLSAAALAVRVRELIG